MSRAVFDFLGVTGPQQFHSLRHFSIHGRIGRLSRYMLRFLTTENLFVIEVYTTDVFAVAVCQ
jgi:hypothetical protein